MTFKQAKKHLAALVTDERSQMQLAKEIGCSKSHLSHVLAGKKSFGLKYAPTIQDKFGIPSSAWFTRRDFKAA